MIAHNKATNLWSCSMILFELLAGHLPFEDRSLTNLYRKVLLSSSNQIRNFCDIDDDLMFFRQITRAEYTCPAWFTDEQRRLISRILDPLAIRVITYIRTPLRNHRWMFHEKCRNINREGDMIYLVWNEVYLCLHVASNGSRTSGRWVVSSRLHTFTCNREWRECQLRYFSRSVR